MAQDPAFLLYSGDFLTGIADLTMEERGQFITLLCLQHQKESLTEKAIKISVPNISPDVMKKFSRDESGNFFNSRLRIESDKRKQHAEKQRQRAISGWKKRKYQGEATANATALPLEDENENRDINRNKDDSLNESEILEAEVLEAYPFELFWDYYDKKTGDKKKCYKKYNKLKDSEKEQIFATLDSYKEVTQDKQFRKNPETYLNQRGWEHEIINNGKQTTENIYERIANGQQG